MKWYSAVALYSQYQKAVARYTEPYGVMPASIYTVDEYRSVPETRRESFRNQVLNGIPLGEGHYLRLFPVWMDYRGHFGTILPQAQALINAAHLRGDLELVTMAQRQVEWIVGRNPFSQSAMYGEGFDFPPLYAPFPGNVVGALPVGLQTRGDRDVPYWPVQSTWTYKEVWVHPVARWIWLMRDLAGPALVEGHADSPVEFIATGSKRGAVIRTNSINGQFRVMLPEGKYTVRCAGEELARDFLPAGTYHLDLRSGRALDYEVSKSQSANGEVRIRSRSVSRTCPSVSMSFHTQSGPVLYSRGGSLKSALARADSVAPHDRPGPKTQTTIATASSPPMAESETPIQTLG
jgi:hypothetical protein